MPNDPLGNFASESPSRSYGQLTSEIDLEECGGDGVRYRLPVRNLGRVRWGAWLIVGAGLVIAVGLLSGPVARLTVRGPQFGNLVSLILTLGLIVFLIGIPVRFALLFLLGRCEIELNEGWLIVRERMGLLGRTRKWPLTHLKRLQVVGFPESTDLVKWLSARSGPSLTAEQAHRLKQKLAENRVDTANSAEPGREQEGLVQSLNALTGVGSDGKRFLILAGYPRDWLTQLSNHLASRCDARRQSDPTFYGVTEFEKQIEDDRTHAPSVELAPPILGLPAIVAEAKEAMRRAAEPDVLEQPIGSDVLVEWFPDGVTLTIPPAGVWKGSAGMFQFGLLWCAGIAGFTTLFLSVGHAKGDLIGVLAMMSPFWLAGAGLLFASWRMGTREAAISVVGPSVMLVQTGVWRATRREWSLSDIESIRVGVSGMSVNDEPVPELQFHGGGKQLFGMLVGRDPRELAWMATVLRRALHVNAPPKSKDGTEVGPPEEKRAVDATNRQNEVDYRGMSVDERLQVAKLTGEFRAAIDRRDRMAMAELLRQVDFPETGTTAFIEAVLTDSKRYGY